MISQPKVDWHSARITTDYTSARFPSFTVRGVMIGDGTYDVEIIPNGNEELWEARTAEQLSAYFEDFLLKMAGEITAAFGKASVEQHEPSLLFSISSSPGGTFYQAECPSCHWKVVTQEEGLRDRAAAEHIRHSHPTR